eukprot:7472958-Pyramimonas_sp.AAC.1
MKHKHQRRSAATAEDHRATLDARGGLPGPRARGLPRGLKVLLHPGSGSPLSSAAALRTGA